MREIKFRAKRLDTGGWVYGDLIYPPSGTAIIMIYIALQYRVYDKRTYVVDNDTICQFTGLTDRNGKQIFEGDIISLADLTDDLKAVVVYNEEETAFCLKLIGSDALGFRTLGSWLSMGYDVEVIGNRYDHPDLIINGEK